MISSDGRVADVFAQALGECNCSDKIPLRIAAPIEPGESSDPARAGHSSRGRKSSELARKNSEKITGPEGRLPTGVRMWSRASSPGKSLGYTELPDANGGNESRVCRGSEDESCYIL